jgi:hypothetical protein
VKILALLSSDVHGGDGHIEQQSLFPALMREPLARALNEPVEVIARPIWPTTDLPRVLDGWMSRYEPDLVMFAVSPFWFLYESLPLRLGRRFGRVGAFGTRVALAVAATPWLAHNRAFQSMRRAVQRRVPGSGYFEPGEVVATSQMAIRAILRREGAYLVVVGPAGGDDWATDARSAQRIAERRAQVNDAMASFCRLLHLEYWDVDGLSKMADPQAKSLQGDRLHLDEAGHKRTAEYYLELSTELCRRAQAHARSQREDASRSISAG